MRALSFPSCAMEGHELGAAKREGGYSKRSCFCGYQTESRPVRRRGQDARGSRRLPRLAEDSKE